LYSKIISPTGGGTLWSSLTSIYDALPKHIKNYLKSPNAVHDMGDFRNTYLKNELIGDAEKLNKGFPNFGSSIYPIIKNHPINK